MFRPLFALVIAVAMGCQSQIHSAAGGRAPTSPSEVKFYQAAPNKYEVLGTVEVPVGDGVQWKERGDGTLGFEKLRVEAAKLGANGVLLDVDGDSSPRVTAAFRGTFYQVPLRTGAQTTAVARAIHVVRE